MYLPCLCYQPFSSIHTLSYLGIHTSLPFCPLNCATFLSSGVTEYARDCAWTKAGLKSFCGACRERDCRAVAAMQRPASILNHDINQLYISPAIPVRKWVVEVVIAVYSDVDMQKQSLKLAGCSRLASLPAKPFPSPAAANVTPACIEPPCEQCGSFPSRFTWLKLDRPDM